MEACPLALVTSVATTLPHAPEGFAAPAAVSEKVTVTPGTGALAGPVTVAVIKLVVTPFAVRLAGEAESVMV